MEQRTQNFRYDYTASQTSEEKMNGAGITGESPGGKIGWILNLHFIPGYTPRNQNLDLKKKTMNVLENIQMNYCCEQGIRNYQSPEVTKIINKLDCIKKKIP